MSRIVGRMAASMLLLLGTATAAQGQLDLSVTGQVGAALPAARLADYMDPGASVGLQIEYPLATGFGLVLGGEWDALNGKSAYSVPDMNLWRYRAAVEAELLGRDADSWGLRAQVGAGGTTFRSKEFYVDNAFEPERFKATYFTGTGGLKLLFGEDSRIGGHVGAYVNWTPMDEDETEILAARAQGRLDRLDTAFTIPLTLGLRILT